MKESIMSAAACGDLIGIRQYLNSDIDQAQLNAALHKAISSGNEEIVETLLIAGADINDTHGPFGTALHASLIEDYICDTLDEKLTSITQMLLDYGASYNTPNAQGLTPLHYAIIYPIQDDKPDINAQKRRNNEDTDSVQTTSDSENDSLPHLESNDPFADYPIAEVNYHPSNDELPMLGEYTSDASDDNL